ncbi:putative RING finger domain protein [Aspergillus saccharolyticus JOP 1030-1]|uniref:RING-type domain-containing protein n=1 Tax=Aspergillus saccharolyticus JOP 1030-1 TaxID=1450539 RepID=A0A318ZIW8_9EURO|nr:hypothetical protein BP01DRAFT_226017 [Aspergillus saccharolyticus JOP 1030-1]PYH40198.1 hypothetical protein BP01DRAFT_226017 [Aspergillus saccharolyticus JOP 1030-1]
MDDDSAVQFVSSRARKRPHHEIARASRSQLPGGESSSSRTLPQPSPPHRRYPGDGLDFRRPTTSTPPSIDEVIDLTLDSDPPEPDAPRHIPIARQDQFTQTSQARAPEVVDLEEEYEDLAQDDPPSSPEVQFIGATARPPRPPPPPTYLDLQTDWSGVLSILARPPGLFPRAVQALHPWDADVSTIGDPLGYIDLTHHTGVRRAPQRPPPNAYKPPSPPPAGFTRTLEEDDVVVCPNCDGELGVGDEIRQQIWVAKHCGHVYCGHCAHHRSKTKSKKSSTSKPFSTCQVSGCGKPVSAPKAMLQIYL